MRHAWWTIACALLASGLAGCLDPPAAGDADVAQRASDRDTARSDAREAIPDSASNASTVPSAPAMAAPSFGRPVAVSDSLPGGEPVVAVATDGTIFLGGGGFTETTGKASVWRSTDDGETWIDVTPPFPTAREAAFDFFVAVGNDDRVYAANAAGTTLHMFRSDDLGDNWLPLAVPAYPVPMHRMWIATEGASTVHLAVERLTLGEPFEAVYLRSEDLGLTWTITPLVDTEAGFGSQLVVDGSDGTIYWAHLATNLERSSGSWTLLRSSDGGATWGKRPMFDLEKSLEGGWQSLSVDPTGTLYFVWGEAVDESATTLYAFSTDGGETWSERRIVSQASGAQTLAWAAARGAGELGVAWYAADEHGLPDTMDAAWFVDYAFVSDADSAAPRSTRIRVTEEPIHHGNICLKGPGCDYMAGDDRDLMDYLWMAFGPDDRAHIAFASDLWEKPGAFPMYAGEAERFAAASPAT